MKLTNKQFDKLRFYVEIIGYIFACVLAISDSVGFKYGSELAGIIAAINFMLGNVLSALRREYIGEDDNYDSTN